MTTKAKKTGGFDALLAAAALLMAGAVATDHWMAWLPSKDAARDQARIEAEAANAERRAAAARAEERSREIRTQGERVAELLKSPAGVRALRYAHPDGDLENVVRRAAFATTLGR